MQEVHNFQDEQVVVFTLDGQTYGIPISAVLEIIRMQKITGIPQSVDFLEGVIEIRGKVIPVMDLRKRFGLPAAEHTGSTRIIIVDMGGTNVGIVVDSVSEVLRVPAGKIEPAPPLLSNIEQAFIKGIALVDERMIILLDLARVLYDEEKELLHSVTAEQQL